MRHAGQHRYGAPSTKNFTIMFYILHKSVGGRVSERYFKNFENCKKEYLKAKEERAWFHWTITEDIERFNADKGFEDIEFRGLTNYGEPYTFAILNGYFED